MNSQFLRLSSDDVIVIDPENFERLEVPKTMTPGDLLEAIKEDVGSDNQEAILFTEGMEAKVLRPGDGWKKGKIRLCIEFCPDEPEVTETAANNKTAINPENSSLDDLRQQLKNIS
ncbi:KGK domain-containing protein [Okeanomitos corallinicola TIOX110]|uniref:KGK domain-containing protein n=1 Tax=Okeanomitos corallinicola TIOX110 TaxID=3133117 RepID=A0ABZ2UQR5_9CYAN